MKSYSKVRLKKKIEDYFEQKDCIKSLAGLADYLEIDTKELNNWIDGDPPEFSGLLGRAKTRIERDIVENGLKGKYNATMSSFLLKTVFGYSERQSDRGTAGNVRVELADELKKYAV